MSADLAEDQDQEVVVEDTQDPAATDVTEEDSRKLNLNLFDCSRSPPRRSYRDRSGSGRRRDRSDSRTKDMREGRCFKCGEKGHRKIDCPEMRRGGDRGRSRSDSRRKYDKRRSYSSSRSRGRDTYQNTPN